MVYNELLGQLLALTLYTFFMGYCFCDGFKLNIKRKLVWFGIFAMICGIVINAKGEYDLALILPVSSIVAIIVCRIEQLERRKRGR
jgi:hypothetical protein